MSQEQWTAVDEYIADLFVLHDPALDAALATSAAVAEPKLRPLAEQGKLLNLLARIQGARNILEIGTLGGYSTIWLARALPSDGRLITLEADPTHAEIARANIAFAGLAKVVELRLGRASDTLPQLVSEGHGPFDLTFIDADKPGYPEYLDWVIKLSRRGSVIISDNVVRKGEVSNPESSDPNVQGMQRFNKRLAADLRVSSTVVQTVGCKGYDGFALSVVTAGQ